MLASEAGYDATTVVQICAHARVGTSTFFRYFPEKQSAFLAPEIELWNRYLEEFDPAQNSLTALDGPLDHVLATAGEQWAEDFSASLDIIGRSQVLAKHSFDHCIDMETTIVSRLVDEGAPNDLFTHMKVGVFLASWRIAQSRWGASPRRTLRSLRTCRRDAFGLIAQLHD